MIEHKFMEDAFEEIDKLLNDKYYKGIDYNNVERMEIIGEIVTKALLEIDRLKCRKEQK